MPYEYNEVVRQWFEELKQPFVNYLHKNYNLSYDEVMDIYSSVWEQLWSNICRGRVAPNTKWKAYIFKMGCNMANKMTSRRPWMVPIDQPEQEGFNEVSFEAERKAQEAECPDVYDNPELKALLGAELMYVPDPCNKILRYYYYDEMSMAEIADAMNYSSARSVIVTKGRCLEKLRVRLMGEARQLGII